MNDVVRSEGALSSGVDAQNPWPGLVAFTEDLQNFFYGRAEEADELLRRVGRKNLTVLFGQSGLGKSSLLQAGLFPRLRAEGYLPVAIRLDHAALAAPLRAGHGGRHPCDSRSRRPIGGVGIGHERDALGAFPSPQLDSADG